MAKETDPNSTNKPSAPSKANFPINAAVIATLPSVYSAQIAVQQQITGPLPSPDVLAKYEAIYPGLVNRIVTMAEEEASHRRSIEADIIHIQGKDQNAFRKAELLGTCCGLIIGLSAIGGSVYAATHGAQIAGSVIGASGICGLVTAFIKGRSSLLQMRQQDLENKKELEIQKPPAVPPKRQ